MSTSDDLVTSYLQAFDELRARKRWSTQSVTLRFVALGLVDVASTFGYDRLEQAATDLRKCSGWFSPLKSEIGYVVAAMILRRGLDTTRIHGCVSETRDGFKAHKVPSRGTGPTLAALLLALHGEGAPVPEEQLERLALIYRRWNTDHRWLTNASDLPAAALHASRNVPVDVLAADVERAYTRLHDAGFRRGQQLQLVSQLLPVDPRGTDTAVDRFCAVAECLKSEEERVGPSQYDEVAVLALTQGPAADVVERVIRSRDRLRQAKARPDKSVAFSLAAGIELSADTERAGERDLMALESIRTILEIQQAMIIAVIATATVTTTATA